MLGTGKVGRLVVHLLAGCGDDTVTAVDADRGAAEALAEGRPAVSPVACDLSDVERLNVDGLEYEAFNTSGGLGTLAETLSGKVRSLDDKSIRYPGHRDSIHLLLEELGFKDDRATLNAVMERSLPHTYQDVVLIFVTVTGTRGGTFEQRSYVKKIYADESGPEPWSAIQLTTAAGLCGALDLHAQGALPAAGFVRQEDIPFDAFIKNRFGKAYA